MNEDFFTDLLKIIGTRRPTWTYIVEDSLIRISTGYYTVDWEIIDEILREKKYKVQDIAMQSALGQVITIRYVAGA